MIVLASSERRAHRRSQRTVAELDPLARKQLRGLLTNACLVVQPTSSIVELVTARLSPGSVVVGVASTEELGIDQTIAVSEILATRGFDVRPHIARSQLKSPRHLAEMLTRLRTRGVRGVLVVPGSNPGPSAPPLPDVVADVASHAPGLRVGVGSRLIRGAAGNEPAQLVIAAARHANFVSTRSSVRPGEMLAWAAEMRVRGLEVPIELGLPGAVPMQALRRNDPTLAAHIEERRRAQWHNPTSLVASLAQDRSLDRLGVCGVRIDTLNYLNENAAWRQQLFDLANPNRVETR